MEDCELSRVVSTMKGSKKVSRIRLNSEAVSALMLIITLIWLPIPKAGMMPSALPLLLFSAIFIFVISVFWLLSDQANTKIGQQTNHYSWAGVWLTVLIASVAHLWVLPELLGWGRFFESDIDFQALSKLPPSSVDALGALSVFGFFSSMWVIAWRASLLSRRHVQMLVLTIFVVASFQAGFGLLHLLSGAESVLGLWPKQHYLPDATGTFVNRNHFANFLAVCWPLLLACLLADRSLLFSSHNLYTRIAIAIVFSCLVMAALLASHSRMGIIAAFAGVLVWAGFSLRKAKNISGSASKWFPVGIFLSVVLFAVWFGVEDLFGRFLLLADGDSRTEKWAATFNLPFAAWMYGIGPGSFEDVFALVQPEHQQLRYLYAHNDYLEFILEFGVIFSMLIVLSAMVLIRRAWPVKWSSLRRGALGSFAVVLLHSLVDFSLQIPASALMFWIAFGLFLNPNTGSETKQISN